MDYAIIEAESKPISAPDRFTVFKIKEDDYIFCPVRHKAYKVNNKPEEIVRQWWIYKLKENYNYSFEYIGVEVPVIVGSTEAKKKADIVVYNSAKKNDYRIFIEVKEPNRTDGVEQLKVYMNATGCRLGLWSNGNSSDVALLRIEPKQNEEKASWRELRNIPRKNESLGDVDMPITRSELVAITDFLSILKECENYIKAHEGTNAFEEMFKLIFAKLYDEKTNLKNDDSPAQFRVGILEAQEQVQVRIKDLFDKAKQRWSNIFEDGESIQLGSESLSFCVSALQKIYLLKSNADILGSAFEVMINPGMKGDKGQYFTPRHVIKMCIEILSPQDGETVFDPACGSGGFLIGAMDYVFRKIEKERDDPDEIIENKKDYSGECIFGMDYDRMIAKVAKAYMLIWGDGRSNIVVCDSLNEDGWSDYVKSKYTLGEGKIRKLKQFDIIATNPPFAGDIDADGTLSKYEIAFKPNKNGSRKRVNKLSRDKLYIERCLKMLKPNGRMAIVLPRGVLKNYNDEYFRRYILAHAEIKAVVSLTGSMFKPFTNTKTCVLFIQKREETVKDLNQIYMDSNIAYCVSERPGKDKSGKLTLDLDGKVVSDLEEISNFVSKVIGWRV
ncbi:MAG: type I restriction-modification system methyltransferase subunit [Solidesulfovibrio magneticus str. Maddingley MBC34]|uniref:Type I restriction-modification system methyltransferase subunit n=1 Tax=Solidesulfovibrio magneticus str. Maddingley MBC34 TaxID=1206767 RepID=K6FPG1_9BACT|nr:MAG: type I restriction-modification system methyltransferase subunit [Solidesulfovibrio magneticus str. Maddingley MBC34]